MARRLGGQMSPVHDKSETRGWSLSDKLDHLSMPEPNSGCQLWLGCTYRHGYGQINWRGRARAAHRLAWEVANGPIPDGLVVCHRCDVAGCINPQHMWLGTQADNIRDMMSKGRSRHSKGVPRRSKISDEQVAAIKSDPRIYRLIALDYAICTKTVGKIKLGTHRKVAHA